MLRKFLITATVLFLMASIYSIALQIAETDLEEEKSGKIDQVSRGGGARPTPEMCEGHKGRVAEPNEYLNICRCSSTIINLAVKCTTAEVGFLVRVHPDPCRAHQSQSSSLPRP
jgi:hypothetical protein